VVVTILSAGFLAGGIILNRYESSLPDSDNFKDIGRGLWIGSFAAAGAFAGLSVFLFLYDPTDDSTAKISPPREFTGELPPEQELPKKPEERGSLPFDVGLLFDGAALPPAALGPAAATPPLPVPAGLVVRGVF
jgi:hypothetical protein